MARHSWTGVSGSQQRTLLRLFVTVALVATSLGLLGSQPAGAVATTKKFSATCAGADGPTRTLLASFGSIKAPVTVVTEAPAFVEPGQTDVPISLKISLSLDASTVDTVAAISSSLTVSNVKADGIVSGPTSTKLLSAPFPPQTITLTKGKPFVSSFPAINGTLKDIGNSGIIKVATQKFDFTIKLASGPIADPLNLTCTTGTTLATIPVKVAGSPDIVQPIEANGTPGSEVTVDVLADYVTNGFTKDGKEQQVDPSTLKVVDGPGTIVDGKVVATVPPVGESADVTFEVCAGTIKAGDDDPGTSEVQSVRMLHDVGAPAFRRQLAVRFGFDGEVGSQVAWSAQAAPLTPLPFGVSSGPGSLLQGNLPPDPAPPPEGVTPAPTPWQLEVNNFALLTTFAFPTPEMVQAALESVPSIGAGNVTVTAGAVQAPGSSPDVKPEFQFRDYEVTFTGALANKAVEPVEIAKLYSFLPNEIRESLIGLASSLGDAGGGGAPAPPPEYPIPAGLTPLEYFEQLNAQAGANLASGDFIAWAGVVPTLFGVLIENITEIIDINAVLEFIDSIFQPVPVVSTLTQGEDPTTAEDQELCSQGLISVASATVEGGPDGNLDNPGGDGGAPGGGDGVGLEFTG